MTEDPNNPPDADGVDPLTWELTREQRQAAAEPAAPKAHQVHTYRPPSTTDRVGAVSATASVFGALLGRGAGHAMPVVVKLILLGVAIAIIGSAVLLLSQRFGTANEVRKELDTILEEYRRPLIHSAGRLSQKADVKARFDIVEYALDPVIETLPGSVRFKVFHEVDRLEMALGTGTRAEGTIYLARREYQIKLIYEGGTVASDVIKLPDPEEDSDTPK